MTSPTPFPNLPGKTPTLVDTINQIPELATGITLVNILGHMASIIECDDIFFALRRGDVLNVQASWPDQTNIQGLEIPIRDSPILQSIFETQTAVLLDNISAPVAGLSELLPDYVKSWLGIPTMTGSRIIALLVFASKASGAFSIDDRDRFFSHVQHFSNVIEHAILFEEASRYLHQLASVNELAAVASSAVDIDEAAKRILQRLRLIFEPDWAKVTLLASDRSTTLEYGEDGLKDQVHSELNIPLRYQGQIIGTISLQSRKHQAFTTHDNQLMQIISSHLAGTFENMRLNSETQEHAKKLSETVRQLKESQAALIRAEKMATLGKLMASIAHEINNPLQALQNCLHLVGRQELEDEVRENYLHLAQTELTRLMSTVQRMLDYFRPASLDRKTTNVHMILDTTLALVAKQLENSRISVTRHFYCDYPNTLAVSDQLQQVFLNIILNAEQAIKNGGKLTISTRTLERSSSQPQIEILFADTGPGIPEQLRESIFDPFTSDKEDGHGLGLAISYGIISAHDGTLELVDETNLGACFRIVLNAIISDRSE